MPCNESQYRRFDRELDRLLSSVETGEAPHVFMPAVRAARAGAGKRRLVPWLFTGLAVAAALAGLTLIN